MRWILMVGLLVLPAASIAAASDAAAQTVVGHVLEEGTQRPLGGAFVVLEEPDGTRRAAVLAGDDGRFALRAPAPGDYRLVARLIGYADAATEVFTLAAGETVERSIRVDISAVNLDAITAEVGARCHGRPAGGAQTERLWEEARKALEITDWLQAQNVLRFHIIEHHRELDAASLRVTAMREGGRRGYYDGSPYRSIPVERLAAEGYVQPVAGSDAWDHFGPDAEVLLSDEFLDAHCFRAHTGEDERLVGLAFEPVPGRTLPDIEGVIWLDRGTAELRHLEFTYVNLPYPHGDWPQVGGRVEFERLSTGMWIVRRWHVRMPLAAEPSGGWGGERRELVLRSLVEQGAVVSSVRTRSGDVLSESTGATLYGTVVDSASGRPLAGAEVRLAATDYRTTTGPDGAYRLGGLPGGTFEVRVAHPELELFGAAPLVREARLEPGRATRLAVQPPVAQLALKLCARAGSFRDPVVVHGTVRDPAAGTPVPGALVRIFGAGGERQVVADSTGGYATCVERSDAVELAAAGPAAALAGTRPASRQPVTAPAGVLAPADLTLPKEAMAANVGSGRTAHRGGQWSNALIGTVLRADDGAPVSGAMVVVRDTDGTAVYSAVTNDDGRFRFMHPDQTTEEFDLSVEHVGYGEIRRSVTFRPGEQLDVEVLLAERAIELDPIVVTQRRQGRLVDVGFYDRLARGMGVQIQREEIERRSPSKITDLLQGRSGVRVRAMGALTYDIRTTRWARFQEDGYERDCQPSIWLDGALVRDSGEPVPRQLQLSDVISPDEVEAIEVYVGATGTPLQYGGTNASCGVVLIWTR